jgi:sugar phosphate isomerase/epimerase
MMLAQEDVSRCVSGRLESICRLHELLGKDIKFVFDVKQAIRAGVDPCEMLAAMGRDVVTVHVSDNTPEQDCMLPGRGSFNFRLLLGQLRRQQYTGPLIVEVYRSNFGEIRELSAAKIQMERILETESQ